MSRRLLAAFYRRNGIGHPERIPLTGPLVVVANHHGSLVDPMLLVAGIARPLRPLAKAPLFQHPVVRPFLRALGALPVYRPQDRHLVQGSNRGLFAAVVEALARADAILIFPEGISRATPELAPLKPGAARMALEAEAENGWSLGIQVLPIGIHFDEGAWFRRGRAFALCGEPIAVKSMRTRWEQDPDLAVIELTAGIETAIRELIVEVAGTEELKLLRRAVRAWSRERGERPDDLEEARIATAFARGWRRLLASAPAEALALRTEVEAWNRTLEHFALAGDDIDHRYSARSIAGFALLRVPALLLAAPLGLAGLALHALPFHAVGIVAGRLSEGEDAWASVKLGASLVAFPLTWLAVALVVGLAAGVPWGLVALVVAPLLGLGALEFRDRATALGRELNAFLLLAGPSPLAQRLAAARRDIHARVEALRLRLEGEPALSAPPRSP